MLYSYDIFDTLIFRTVPKSTDIFCLMQNDPVVRSILKDNVSLFPSVRRKAEFLLRRSKKQEITIGDIYNSVKKKLRISNDEVDQLIKLEIKTEKRNSVLNHSLAEEIKNKILNGDSVILISDMYWDSKAIRELLVDKDSIFRNIPIYVSSDYGYKKSNGTLFKYLIEKKGYNPKLWIHIGDNYSSDYIQPKKFGIETMRYENTGFDFEKKQVRNAEMLDTYKTVVISRSRSTGKSFSFGCSFAGPLIFQYVEWVINQSIKLGIQKLYFVLRDGYILKLVAEKIIKARALDLETDYIFGSRVAWRFPELDIEKLRTLSVWDKSNWIFRDPCYAYIVYERLGFTKRELEIIMGSKFSNELYKTFDDFKNGINLALDNENFVSELKTNIRDSKEKLLQYLEQTLTTDKTIAFVDTNSTGKTQKDLDRLQNESKLKIPSIIFFYHTFLSKIDNPKTQIAFIDALRDDNRLPEALFRAPYNPCYGYQIENETGAILPKFADVNQSAWDYSFDYDEYVNGILAFTEEILKSPRLGSLSDQYIAMLYSVANFDIKSKDIIDVMAKLPFNPNFFGEEINDFYPEIKTSNLLHPFSQLIYFPKGSYYSKGMLWPAIYKLLNLLVKTKRKLQ